MEGTFILSDYKEDIKEITNQIGISENQVISFPSFDNESGWHNWTTQLFKDNDIKKLVVPISIPTDSPINSQGLMIALHIRLNYELSIEKRLIPIIFLSDFSLDVILRKNNFDVDNNSQNLLFTKGVFLSSFDKDEILNTITKSGPCYSEDYRKLVLNKLRVLQKASTGKHSIANAWGCLKLALVTGLRNEIFKLDAVSDMLKTLYAKYLICYNEVYSEEKRIDLQPLKCLGKKILFIDDQADEGWSELMTNIFKSAGNNFVSVDSSKYKNKETKQFHDFDGFYNESRSHICKDWDLIIIDLRLNPEKEDIDNEMITPTDFSGYKLIDEFLNENSGYQIIVSTASNKIWNINAALDRGASSYYVKESPEFNYTINDTNKHYENFKTDVQKCFDKCYLRDIYKETKQLIQKLNVNSSTSFINEIINQLMLAYSLLKSANSKEQFAYAYVSLYLVIEIINNDCIIKGSNDKWEINGNGCLLDWKWDANSNSYTNSGAEVIGNKPPEWQKFAGLYYQKWNLSDHNFIKQLYFLIIKRNGFVHNDKSILDKEDNSGKYLNHDVFKPDGYIKLFRHIKKIISYL